MITNGFDWFFYDFFVNLKHILKYPLEDCGFIKLRRCTNSRESIHIVFKILCKPCQDISKQVGKNRENYFSSRYVRPNTLYECYSSRFSVNEKDMPSGFASHDRKQIVNVQNAVTITELLCILNYRKTFSANKLILHSNNRHIFLLHLVLKQRIWHCMTYLCVVFVWFVSYRIYFEKLRVLEPGQDVADCTYSASGGPSTECYYNFTFDEAWGHAVCQINKHFLPVSVSFLTVWMLPTRGPDTFTPHRTPPPLNSNHLLSKLFFICDCYF